MTAPATGTADQPIASSEPTLLRALGPGMAVAIVVGNVIGAGIFAKPSVIARECGDFSMIMTGWVLGGIYCLLGALCFAELAAMLPKAGGLYVYLRESYGRFIAFQFGFNEYLFGRPASIAALAVFFGEQVNEVTHRALGPTWQLVIALVAILALTGINILGVIWGGRMQGLTTYIKTGVLVVFALLPFVLTLSGTPAISAANYTTTVTPELTGWSMQFAAVIFAVMWAYNGWHDIAPVAEEVRDPQRNIPLSLIGGVLILMAVYLSVNLAYHGVLTMSEIAGAGYGTAQVTLTKVLGLANPDWAPWGTSILTAMILCSVFGTINANLLLGPRIAFAMARDGIFWRPLAHVHPRFRTPSTSILFQGLFSCGLILFVKALINTLPVLAKHNIFDLLTNIISYSANLFFALCVLGVFLLRRQHPEWERPYKTWGYPVVPILFLLMQLWFSVAAFYAKPIETLAGLGIIGLGIPGYFWALRHQKSPAAAHPAID